MDVCVDVSIPITNFKFGDLVLKKFESKTMKEYLGRDINNGKILVIFIDVNYEPSRSTVISAREKINEFNGRVYFIGESKEEILKFLEDINLSNYEIIEKKYDETKKIGVNEFPSILLLKDGEPFFWIKGPTFHLEDLIK